MIDYSFEAFKDRKTIITGDVGTGKTVLTKRLLEIAIDMGEQITVLDFAPKRDTIKGFEVGGHLLDESKLRVRHLKSEDIKTPRLSAESPEQLLSYADYNKDITSHLIEKFLEEPTSTLFINDVSIHLQRGELDPILKAVARAETVIINGYMGVQLRPDQGTGISERENFLMQRLAAKLDREINLKNNPKVN